MEDGIFERLGKTAAILVGGYLFLYIMIVTTQRRPAGIALLIVNVTETLAKGLLYLSILVAVVLLGISLIENMKAKKIKQKEQEDRIEREIQLKITSLEKENKRLERHLILAEEEKQRALAALQVELARQIVQENHLKKRSAEEAVDEAFKHFM